MDTEIALKEKDKYKASRIAYIFFATFEYFIGILTTGVYLAKLTTTIGISDGMTAILSTVASFAGMFQIVSLILAHKTPVKRWILPIIIVSHSLISTLYIIPFFGLGSAAAFIFFFIMLTSSVFSSIIAPAKSNWTMSLVDDKNRGSFQSKLSIVSFIGGMIFTVFASRLIDSFEANGNIEGAFITLTVIICTLAIFEFICLFIVKEPPIENPKKNESVLGSVKSIFKNKPFVAYLVFNVTWGVANNISVPFYSTYEIKELGFSLTFITTVGIVLSLIRIGVLSVLGPYSKKHSYIGLLMLSYILQTFAIACVAISNPSNGYITFNAYRLMATLASGASIVSEVSFLFHIIPPEDRTGSIAIKTIICGSASFLSTLITRPIFEALQAKEIYIFESRVYAQQILSFVSALIMMLTLTYFYFFCYRPVKKHDLENQAEKIS